MRVGLMKGLSLLCIVGGLACKLFIKNNTLGSTLAIVLMVLAVIILAITMRRSRKQ